MKLLKSTLNLLVITMVFYCLSFADNNTKITIGKLIKEGKIEEAKKKVEEILSENPQDVDALMMKGNVIINEYLNQTGYGNIEISVNQNESIYDTTIGFMGASQEPIIINRLTAENVSKLWLNCIKLDPSREDIYLGLCYLYSEALMKDELINRLKITKNSFPKDDLMYNMGDYARMFIERGQKKEGMEIYLYISELFPNQAGLLSDIAGTYFNLGDMKNAEVYSELSIKANNPDEYVYKTYSFINFVLGNYEKSIFGIKQSKEADNLWQLYQGIYYYYQNNTEWNSTLSNFINNTSLKGGVELANFLISSDNTNDYESFLESKGKEKGIYNILLYKRAMEKFPDKFQPYYLYAEIMTYYKNYTEAINVFNLIETKKISLTEEESNLQNYYFAWALQDSGKLDEASTKWLKLIDSENFNYKSAACFFYGKYLMNKGNIEEAKKIFTKVSDEANKSKFATYCWNLLNSLNKK